jgi:hypothetical protein
LSNKITYTTLPCRGSFTAVTVTEDTQRYISKKTCCLRTNCINEIRAKTTNIMCSERSTARHCEERRREIPTNPRVKVSYVQSVPFIADLSTTAVTGHRSGCRLSVRQVCRALVRDRDVLYTWKPMSFLRGHATDSLIMTEVWWMLKLLSFN